MRFMLYLFAFSPLIKAVNCVISLFFRSFISPKIFFFSYIFRKVRASTIARAFDYLYD